MESKDLQQLRDIGFEVTIDPKNALHAADAADVINVLNAYITSYKSYLEIQLKKDNQSDDAIKETIKNTKLLVVDTEFNSYHNCLAPYNPQDSRVIPVFNNYKDEILEADMHDYSDMQRLITSYTKEQLHSIYNPIFSAVSNDYSLKIKTSEGKEKKVVRPKKEYATYFKPPKSKKIEINNNKLFQVYVESSDLKNISARNIIYSAELDHATYPYNPDRILYAGIVFFFYDSINAEVTFVDNLYFISYQDLNIEVWGDSREEAEKAFDFTFYSLYLNYAQEDDKNLTDDAIQLKDKLTTMIRFVK